MSFPVNHDDVLQQLQSHGLIVESPLRLAKGKKSLRCRVEGGDREKRGWYRLYEWVTNDGDVMLVGCFGIYSGSDPGTQKVELTKRCTDCGREMALKERSCPSCGSKASKRREISEEQKTAMKNRMAEDKRLAEAEEKRRHERAAQRAEMAWRGLLPVGESAYLQRKQVEGYGVRYSIKGNIAIPIQDTAGRIHGLQVIYGEKKAERDKDYWPYGLNKQGHFFLIGGIPSSVLLVAEGYATAASLHLATGLPVAVAFDAGNLQPVIINLHKHYPQAQKVVCADDDYLQKCKHCKGWVLVSDPVCSHCGQAHETKNPGIEAAKAAAMAVGGSWVAPVFAQVRPTDCKGINDFNDLHVAEGIRAVRSQIEGHLIGLNVSLKAAPAREPALSGERGNKERNKARSVMELNDIVERFVPIDDGSGKYVFDLWTNKVVHKEQMLSLLPAGVRNDDIKRHPYWIARGAFYIDEIGFDPSGKEERVKLNTWQGWPIRPKKGDCALLLELISYLCGGEANGGEVYEWLLDWMAYPLQYPGTKMSSAVVMHGPQGTGKSTVFQALVKIYGDYATVLNQRGLESEFNSDWVNCKLFVLAEEVVSRSEIWNIRNELKELITGEWVRVHGKSVNAYPQRNYLNLVFLSNENQPVPLDNDDRRHLVIYTPPAKAEEFYDRLNRELCEGGVEAFYDFLLRRDLSNFHPKKRPPFTESKRRLILLSMSSDLRFVNEWISGDLGLPVCPCLSMDLYAAYLRWCRVNGESRPRSSNQFFPAIENQPKWIKKKSRYNGSAGPENKPVVFPSPDILNAAGSGTPEGAQQTVWLGGCVEKFSSALREYEQRAA